MKSYLEIKEDVKSLVDGTVNMGNQILGGLGRASEEYWLDPLHVNSHGPCFLTKFMARMAILKMRADNELDPDYELREIAFYLVAKLSQSDIENMSDNCIKDILWDSKDIYEFNWYVIHVCLNRSA